MLARARHYRAHLVGLFLLSLLSSPLALLLPLPVKIVVDSVLGPAPLPGFLGFLAPVAGSTSARLLLAVGLLVAVTLLVELQSLGADLLRIYTGEKLVLEFRSELFRYVQRLSFSYSDRRGTADSIYRIQNDAPAIQSIAVEGVIPFITSAVTVVGMIYVTARIDLKLALLALGVTPALLVALGVFRTRLRRRSRQVKQLETSALSVVQEVLGALRVVKAFAQEDREQERFLGKATQGMRARIALVFAESGLGLVLALITGAGSAAALYIGVLDVQAGVLTLGELLIVLAYLTQLYSPLRTMSSKVARLQSNLASAERGFELLDQAPDVDERLFARHLRRAAGEIELQGVTFAYEDGRPALDNVSLKVLAGTRLGIAGTTGAGKTTFVSLLTRFYDPSAGRILLDGRDLRAYKLADLRRQFAIVLQEPVLFSASIAENIAYARPEASRDEIVASAEAAGAQGFISSLPQGYDTLVGERGMALSGGERQRIALARAFLKDAPVLILDEPTSSVDLATEAVIMEALQDLMRGRTTFMIAHRPSTLQQCDLIVRIEEGRAVPVGAPLGPGPAAAPAGGGHPVGSVGSGDQALREVLETGLSVRLGRSATIKDLRREPFGGATSYASEVLTVQLAGDGAHRVFVKDFRYSKLPKDEPAARCRRELGVYRDLLSKADLGTAEFYGTVETGGNGRHRLLLEFVDGMELRSSKFLEWVRAAGWLARLHGSFASEAERLAACDFLVRHDADFFTSRAQSALQVVSASSEAMGARLGPLLAGYGRVVEAMVSQPRTLVHGSYRPSNILVGPGSTRRTVPVDWELAAVGAPLYDLAFLCDGFRPPELDALLGTYRQQADQEGLRLPDPEELGYLLDCFRFHKVVKSLSDSAALGFPPRTVEKLLRTAERLGGRLMTP